MTKRELGWLVPRSTRGRRGSRIRRILDPLTKIVPVKFDGKQIGTAKVQMRPSGLLTFESDDPIYMGFDPGNFTPPPYVGFDPYKSVTGERLVTNEYFDGVGSVRFSTPENPDLQQGILSKLTVDTSPITLKMIEDTRDQILAAASLPAPGPSNPDLVYGGLKSLIASNDTRPAGIVPVPPPEEEEPMEPLAVGDLVILEKSAGYSSTVPGDTLEVLGFEEGVQFSVRAKRVQGPNSNLGPEDDPQGAPLTFDPATLRKVGTVNQAVEADTQVPVASGEYPITDAGTEITTRPRPSGTEEVPMLNVSEATFTVPPQLPVGLERSTAVRNAVDEAVNRLARARDAANTALAQLRDRGEPQRYFVGIIRDYKFKAGKRGERPHHRLFVQCDDFVWLYSKVSSETFDELLEDVTGLDEMTAKAIEGTMVILVGDANEQMTVPVGIVKPVGGFDARGHMLYVGAPVYSISDENPRLGKVVEYDTADDEFLVAFEDADDTVYRSSSSLVRAF